MDGKEGVMRGREWEENEGEHSSRGSSLRGTRVKHPDGGFSSLMGSILFGLMPKYEMRKYL